MKRLKNLLIILLFGALLPVYSQEEPELNLQATPNVNDLTFLASIGVLTAGMEFGKAYIGPYDPNFTVPGELDDSIRSSLVWSSSDKPQAALFSDIFLGILASQMVIVPLVSPGSYWSGTVLFAESFIYTAFVTDLIKIMVARQRPYAYYGSGSFNPEDNYSFLSGHTSLAFSMATTGALYLADKYPRLKALIFPVAYIIAAATGYMRIAADKHYLTDVLAGAVVGTGIGMAVYTIRSPWIRIVPVQGGAILQKTAYF